MGSSLPILSICGHSTKSLEDPHSRFHPPEDRVFVVEGRRRSEGEEELGACGFLEGTRWDDEPVRTVAVGTGVSHCQDACTRESQF